MSPISIQAHHDDNGDGRQDQDRQELEQRPTGGGGCEQPCSVPGRSPPPYRLATSRRTHPSSANATRPHAAQSSDAAQSRSGRPPCMAVISSTPSPRRAPYHSPNTAPASAAGAASLSPSTTEGQHAGSCTDQTRRRRGAPSAVATSCAAAARRRARRSWTRRRRRTPRSRRPRPGPRSRPRITSRQGATATHGAALAIAASRVMLRRRAGSPVAAECRDERRRRPDHQAAQRRPHRRLGGPDIDVARLAEDRSDGLGRRDDHAVRPAGPATDDPDRDRDGDAGDDRELDR